MGMKIVRMPEYWGSRVPDIRETGYQEIVRHIKTDDGEQKKSIASKRHTNSPFAIQRTKTLNLTISDRLISACQCPVSMVLSRQILQ